MKLVCKNAHVTITWDGNKTMEVIITNSHGDVLFVQTQGTGGSMTNIHDEREWDEDKYAKEI
jgi:hypothetical protein